MEDEGHIWYSYSSEWNGRSDDTSAHDESTSRNTKQQFLYMYILDQFKGMNSKLKPNTSTLVEIQHIEGKSICWIEV